MSLKMDEALNEFLRRCIVETKATALEYWTTTVKPLLSDDTLCVARPDYPVKADQRWWLWCDRFNEVAQGEQALSRLLLTHRLAWDASQGLQRSALKHVLTLPTRRTVVFEPSAGPGYVASSPFVLPNPDDPTGFLVSVRHVNYRFTEDNHYPLLPEYVAAAPQALRHCVRTVNVLHVCSGTLDIQATAVLKDNTALLRWPSPVLDLEDLRLVAMPSGALLGVAARRELVVSALPQPVLVSVSWSKKECTGGVRLRPHDRALEEQCQKNWLPFWCQRTQRLLAFYCYGPEATLYAVEPTTGTCTVDKTWTTGVSMHAARGGAPPVPWEGGMFLSVVHTSLQDPGVRRKYFHRFVLHAADYQPVAISQQWNFSGTAFDAEFVISCAQAGPETYYLGYGQNDGTSKVAEVAVETIKGLWWYKMSA